MNNSIFPGAYNITQFAKAHNICRHTVYREIRAGRLRRMKVGKRTLIGAEAAADWRRLMEEEVLPNAA